ncbi:MAG TPA: DUF4870 domain-containing protein [Abditibacteriaceae bacterium]|jgi:hypothetical protein
MNTQDPQEKIARNWAMACHLAGLSAYIGVPFGHIFGPLLIWLIKKDEIPFVNDQGREAVNFGITLTIFYIAAFLTALFLIGIPALLALPVVHLIIGIVAAMRASEGEVYRYPFNIRFIN